MTPRDRRWLLALTALGVIAMSLVINALLAFRDITSMRGGR